MLDLEEIESERRRSNITLETEDKTGLLKATFGISAGVAKKNQHEIVIMLVLLKR